MRSRTLWVFGYPDQALKGIHDALILAHDRAHPYSLAFALSFAAMLHQTAGRSTRPESGQRRRWRSLASRGFRSCWRWDDRARLGVGGTRQGEEGIAQMRQGAASQGQSPFGLALLAEAYGKVGQVEEGLTALAKALAAVDRTEERIYEAELYRLKGELLLAQEGDRLQAVG